MLKVLSERKLKACHHVAYDTVLGMENEFSDNAKVELVCLSKFWGLFNKVLHKILKVRLPDYSVKCLSEDQFLFAAMGAGDLETNKETLRNLSKHGCKVSIYCFDTWESEYLRWKDLFGYVEPYAIFLAYKQSAEYFSAIFQHVYFLPQSMDKTFFHDYGEKKERLFMQMGRRNENIHKKILEYMKTHDVEDIPENYIYEKVKGKNYFRGYQGTCT